MFAKDCWKHFFIGRWETCLRYVLQDFLVDRTKMSVSNIQRHVINVRKWVWKWVWCLSIVWESKCREKCRSGATLVSFPKRSRNWAKISCWSGWKMQKNESNDTQIAAAQCSIFSICSWMFSTGDNPFNFARALVSVTLKKYFISSAFNQIFESINAAITLSNDLLPAVCNFPLWMKWFCVKFGWRHLFFKITVAFWWTVLQKQPRISALFCNGYQHFLQAYCSDDFFK